MKFYLAELKKKFLEKEKYKKFIGFWIIEFILIVFGIMCANWVSDNRVANERKEEQIHLLTEFQNQLEEDYAQLVRMYGKYSKAHKSTKIIQKLIIQENPIYHDSLESHFPSLFYSLTFVPSLGAYENLKSQGFDIIDNKELRSHLSKLYDKKYGLLLDKQKYSDDVKIERVRIYTKYFEYNGFDPDLKNNPHAKPVDKTSILKDRNFRNEVFISENIQRWILLDLKDKKIKLEPIIPFVETLLGEIDSELRKLKL